MNNTKYQLIIVILLLILFAILYYKYQKYKSQKYSIDIHNKPQKQLIPKNIIQTWKTEEIPEKYNQIVESVKNNNPDYNYLFFSDSDIDNFLLSINPLYYDTYYKLPNKIQRIDFFRYIAVYYYGGIYLDLDMMIYHQFDSLLSYHNVIPIEQFVICNDNYQRHNYLCNKKNDNKFILGNYAFASKKNSKFMKQVIDNIHNNIEQIVDDGNKEMTEIERQNYIYQTTGPDYLTRQYYLFMNSKNNEKIKLIKNPSNTNEHVFGSYGKHLYFGSWKK
jgi:mannosyltransferase OCH1-like enzyme